MSARCLALLVLVACAAALQPATPGSITVVDDALVLTPPAGGSVLFNGTDVVAVLAALRSQVAAINASCNTQLAQVEAMEVIYEALSVNISAQLSVISVNALLLARQAAVIASLTGQVAPGTTTIATTGMSTTHGATPTLVPAPSTTSASTPNTATNKTSTTTIAPTSSTGTSASSTTAGSNSTCAIAHCLVCSSDLNLCFTCNSA